MHPTRKSMKTNKIIDGSFLLVIFTDGYNSIFNFIGLYQQTFVVGNNDDIDSVDNAVSIYWRNYSIGI
jgi:hypothetical protein